VSSLALSSCSTLPADLFEAYRAGSHSARHKGSIVCPRPTQTNTLSGRYTFVSRLKSSQNLERPFPREVSYRFDVASGTARHGHEAVAGTGINVEFRKSEIRLKAFWMLSTAAMGTTLSRSPDLRPQCGS